MRRRLITSNYEWEFLIVIRFQHTNSLIQSNDQDLFSKISSNGWKLYFVSHHSLLCLCNISFMFKTYERFESHIFWSWILNSQKSRWKTSIKRLRMFLELVIKGWIFYKDCILKSPHFKKFVAANALFFRSPLRLITPWLPIIIMVAYQQAGMCGQLPSIVGSLILIGMSAAEAPVLDRGCVKQR